MMQMDVINIGLGFLEGFALIISPCILPVLPFILAGSLEGGKKRPLGIITGFVLAFALFTFFSRQLVAYSGINLLLIREISYVLLFLFGVVMLSTYLTEKFSLLTQRLMNVGTSFSSNQQGGFLSGVIFGGLVGLIWTPCAGPILAAVIVQSVISQSTFSSFLIILAFGIGAAVPMLLIAFFGRTLLDNVGFFKTHTELLRKLLGAIVILSVAYMVYGEVYTPAAGETKQTALSGKLLINALPQPYPAPDFADNVWINSKPLHISDLRGKVVLVDFWTFSCINCIRTLPYLKTWYDRYHQQGFEIVGVHTPEFEFEKDLENVKHAVAVDGIKYPVVLDSNYGTWQNYHNSYWPAHYLIDKNGNIVYQHFGEGEYAETENNIRFLLGMGATSTPASFGEENIFSRITPETYLGYLRAANYAGNETLLQNAPNNYTYPKTLDEDQWALQGTWNQKAQFIQSEKPDAAIKIHFKAKKVFVVMGNATGLPVRVKVRLNGEDIVKEKGADVQDSAISVNANRLYEAVVLPDSSTGMLELTAPVSGLEIYTFTFGS